MFPSLAKAAASKAPVEGGNDEFTVLLLHCDGADGSTSFPDDSVGGADGTKSILAFGTAQVDTAVTGPFGDNDGAMLSGVTNSGLYTEFNYDDFVFGTLDFTIDFWMYQGGGAPTDQIIWDHRPNAVQGFYPTLFINGGVMQYFTNLAARIVSTTNIGTGWHHIALARASGVTKLFINGVQEGGDYVDTNNYGNGALRPTIGANGWGPGTPSISFGGWMEEIRVSKGIARWTSNFTPPTEPYSV